MAHFRKKFNKNQNDRVEMKTARRRALAPDFRVSGRDINVQVEMNAARRRALAHTEVSEGLVQVACRRIEDCPVAVHFQEIPA